jgi:hypothetical protein
MRRFFQGLLSYSGNIKRGGGDTTESNVNFEANVKSIRNDILCILKKKSNIKYAVMEQKEWWTFAKNLHCHINVAEAEKTDFELDENAVGCYHSTCMIGTGFEKTSPGHTDIQSASVNWAGLPDFHLNLAEQELKSRLSSLC